MTQSQHLARYDRQPWLVLAVISLPVFIGALDLTIISAVLPEVITSLNLAVKDNLDRASWAVSGYLLAYAISMTFMGRLSDLMGRRAIYIACLLIFMLGSYLVTAYDSRLMNSWIARFYRLVLDEQPPLLKERHLYLVITGRVIQAFGAGAMVPVTLALVGDLFPPGKRAKPLGVVGAVDTMGWVLGHLYGGVMVRLFGSYGDRIVDALGSIGWTISRPSWETLFILNIPISLLALIGAWWALRGVGAPSLASEAVPARRGLVGRIRAMRFDLPGALLLSVALLTLNLGLGTSSPETAVSSSSFEELPQDYRGYYLVIAAASFILFLLVELWVKHPLMRLNMFRRRNFAAASGSNFLVGFCLAIGLVSAPLLVNFRAETPSQEHIQQAAYIAGILLSGLTIPMALAAIPGGWLTDRYGYRIPTVLGLGLATMGFVLAGLVWTEDTPYWIMGIQMALIGIGLGLTISPIGTAVINEARENERGVVSALILILRLLGMTVAISSLTIFSLNRFDVVFQERFETLQAERIAENPDAESLTSFTDEEIGDINLSAAVQVINELQYVGAVVSALAMLFAFILRGGPATAPEPQPTPPAPREPSAPALVRSFREGEARNRPPTIS